jgi:hypothetical protein
MIQRVALNATGQIFLREAHQKAFSAFIPLMKKNVEPWS